MREEFMIERQGKKFVLFAGLLDEAHARGLVSLETEEVAAHYDEEHKPLRARHKATALMLDENGEVKSFTGHGDADIFNVSNNIRPHLIRMSETRAKARALRDAINVGVTALEELGGDEPDDPQERQQPRQKARSSQAGGRDTTKPSEPPAKDRQNSEGTEYASDGQTNALKKLAVKARPDIDADEAVSRLEVAAGAPLNMLTSEEAAEWITRLQNSGKSR